MYSYKDEIIENIGLKRYEHSLRVMETAIELGKIYNVSIEQLRLAAYFHDCVKIREKTKLFELAKEYNFKLDPIMINNVELIHSELGALVAKERYGVEDLEVLNAIRYHTTGRRSMTDLEKIIFLADYIEPYRNFPGVEIVRKLAYEDLNQAILLSMDNTIKFLIEKRGLIHPRTIDARNDLINKKY